MIDLVSRVLSAITQREQLAEAALPDAKVFEPLGDRQSPADAHIEANDPAGVLRLCQSLRDIVTEYQGANEAAEKDPEDISARVARFAFLLALRAVARGLGIEEETNG